MRTIYLLRHAKSSWDHPGKSDIERPLSERGQRAAELIRAHIAHTGIQADRVLCSPAVRTRQTLMTILGELPESGSVQFEPSIYHGNETTVQHLISEQDDQIQNVMIIGHNPTLQSLALEMAGRGSDEAARASVRTKLPTGALVTLQSAMTSWSAITPGCCVLTGLVKPRDLE